MDSLCFGRYSAQSNLGGVRRMFAGSKSCIKYMSFADTLAGPKPHESGRCTMQAFHPPAASYQCEPGARFLVSGAGLRRSSRMDGLWRCERKQCTDSVIIVLSRLSKGLCRGAWSYY